MVSYEAQREKNIELLDDTLHITSQGSYTVPSDSRHTPQPASQDGKKAIFLEHSYEELCQASVLFENDVTGLASQPLPGSFKDSSFQRCRFCVENTDSFQAAVSLYEKNFYDTEEGNEKILVLNFANPVHPGGGVRRGAKAQEEDLCRQSTLLASLESKDARPYYEYHQSQNSRYSSDAMIFSPNVEIIRNSYGQLRKEPTPIAVLTCAAPMLGRSLRHSGEMPSHKDTASLEALLFRRICGILRAARFYGCRYLVLGAWGCGAFGNDAQMIANLFYKAFKELRLKDTKPEYYFRQVVFAVLDHSGSQYNYKSFLKYFENYYKDSGTPEIQEAKSNIEINEKWQDKIRGSLIGGAIGDALGYPVEFLTAKEILHTYGEKGITKYELHPDSGMALISDDTQMTLFTANGILFGMTRGAMRGIMGPIESYVYNAYQDWLYTQTAPSGKEVRITAKKSFSRQRRTESPVPKANCHYSWLLAKPELFSQRAPGNTCISALKEHAPGSIENPINHSKGCGGIMRVAPVALYYKNPRNILETALTGAKVCALTHGHSLGYMSGAALVYVINRIVYGGCPNGSTLYCIVGEMRQALFKIFPEEPYLHRLLSAIDKAVEMSKNTLPDEKNLLSLGQGWVAEETLAIALYCSLKYQNDFSRALIVSVNHSGDSDSTGAVTGNIMGAILGYSNIPRQWKRRLELHKTIIEIADDLCRECQMTECGSYDDVAWRRKYIECIV